MCFRTLCSPAPGKVMVNVFDHEGYFLSFGARSSTPYSSPPRFFGLSSTEITTVIVPSCSPSHYHPRFPSSIMKIPDVVGLPLRLL